MTKKIISKKVPLSYGLYDILDSRSPDEAIDIINSIKEVYKGRDVRFVVQGDMYDDGLDLYLFEYRLETDEEYEARLEKERISRDSARERNRAEYERLKKLFED
jgi:hypothetical protein